MRRERGGQRPRGPFPDKLSAVGGCRQAAADQLTCTARHFTRPYEPFLPRDASCPRFALSSDHGLLPIVVLKTFVRCARCAG